jgi:flagellar secretion chaperone FliS
MNTPDRVAQYQAYNMAHRTLAKTRQVVMLYDGAIRFLMQAKEAIQENRIQDRYNLLVKTSDIVLALQGCIDFETGGDVARVLFDFYSSIDSRILSIHRNQSTEMCDQLVKELKMMRDAWDQVDKEMVEKQGQGNTGDPAAVTPAMNAPATDAANVALSA